MLHVCRLPIRLYSCIAIQHPEKSETGCLLPDSVTSMLPNNCHSDSPSMCKNYVYGHSTYAYCKSFSTAAVQHRVTLHHVHEVLALVNVA